MGAGVYDIHHTPLVCVASNSVGSTVDEALVSLSLSFHALLKNNVQLPAVYLFILSNLKHLQYQTSPYNHIHDII